MIYELVYTSAPTGLFPGNTGFSVVGCTRNMDMALCKQLEKLSAYTPLYPHYDANAWSNPVNYAHRIINSNGQTFHILSRICFNGVDYTNRSNKLASHLAISENETQRLPSGPASIFLQPDLFKSEKWRIQTAYFDSAPVLQDRGTKLQPCDTWKQITGDAGWAGFIAENLMRNPQKNVYIVFSPEKSKQNLQLLVEVLNLLPPPTRWQLTFSTYFTELVPGTSCNLRFCLPNAPLLQNARQNPNANLVIDISRPLPVPSGGNLLEIARTGKLPEAHMPLCPAGNAGQQPVAQVPPFLQAAQQAAHIAPKDNGMSKIAIVVMAFFLFVMGVGLLSAVSNNRQKIALLEEELKHSKEELRQSEKKLEINKEKLELSEEKLRICKDKLESIEKKHKESKNNQNTAGESQNTAGGSQNTAGGSQNTAGGSQNTSGGSQNTAGGSQNTAGGSQNTSGGSQNTSGGSQNTSGGSQNTSGGSQNTAGGSQNTAGGSQNTAGGSQNTAGGSQNTSGGSQNTAGGSQNTSGGSQNTSGGSQNTSGGSQNTSDESQNRRGNVQSQTGVDNKRQNETHSPKKSNRETFIISCKNKEKRFTLSFEEEDLKSYLKLSSQESIESIFLCIGKKERKMRQSQNSCSIDEAWPERIYLAGKEEKRKLSKDYLKDFYLKVVTVKELKSSKNRRLLTVKELDVKWR